MKNNTNITEVEKDKLFRMCLLLFPKYSLVKMAKGGLIILSQRKLFSRRIKVSLLELILYYIPNKISLSRWGNYGLSYGYTSKVMDILNDSQYTDNIRYEIAVSYLYSEFVHTKIRNIYTDITEIIIPNEQGHLSYTRNQTKIIPEVIKEHIDEAVVVKGTEFSFIKRIDVLNKVPYKVRYMVASLMLATMLNYNIISTSLSGMKVTQILFNFPVVHQFPWTIIRNTS